MRIYHLFLGLTLCSVCVGGELRTSNSTRHRSDQSGSSLITLPCQRSIDRGMDWLVAAIHRQGGVGFDKDSPPDLSCTAITGLAFLSQGNTPYTGKYSREVRQMLDYVLYEIDRLPESPTKNNARPITLVQRKIGQNADLFLSALFLSQVMGDCGLYEKDVQKQLGKLVRMISSAQRNDGTWGNESWAPVLGTVLGWESLRASVTCGFSVQASARSAGDSLLNHLQKRSSKEQGWMHQLYKEGASIRVLYSLGHKEDPIFEETVQGLIKIVQGSDRPFVHAGGEEYLAFHLITDTLLQDPEESWEDWYPTVRDKLIRVQNADGSWTGHHCITARSFCTAAALLTLQAPKRSMPLSDF